MTSSDDLGMASTVPPPTLSPWVPLWRMIEQIASAIGDSREPEYYARTRRHIRQAALEGRLRIRGRHEIEVEGQNRTIFSEIYTEIPSAYWKHSVINVLATGATYETDRHTGPEKTVYAWGQKGLYEPNCYTGLQLNSDDVSQLIGDVRGTGMSEKEEWISASNAVTLLGMNLRLGTRAICKRAHRDLIKARAQRFVRDGRPTDNVDIPVEFWWAEGAAALIQNWETGDFDTWIDHEVHLEAFGVTFRRSDIERLKPAQEGQRMITTETKIFIGHGHSLVWREFKDFIQDSLHLPWEEFNRIPQAGISTTDRLTEMVSSASFAFLIMTGEDEHADGDLHARENVIHEAGLFQGKLGFQRAIILLEEGCKNFSNVHGLTHIPFPKGRISAAFEEVRRTLRRENVLPNR